MHILRLLAGLAAGTLFGFGLALSGMMDPERVRGFLDIAGEWDPSLAFVLGGAVFVSALGVLLSRRLPEPLLDDSYHLPGRGQVDRRLLIGAGIFGIGWGMGGLCPGPAIANLGAGYTDIVLFVVAMLLGMFVHDRFFQSRQARGLGGRAGAR
ncbi:YeeE/YedE family protein [Fodinicurvata sediminis]|uniref:YeeE/YedE family protein n=1 Tax=Fodinicurvata sediminis TaxID=1121832 RepID=UPI0003B4A5C2|nr:YeeE/YedE family protein [Fodinicurvata sediminis]